MRRIFAVIVPLVVLALGAGAAVVFFRMAPPPAHADPEEHVTSVEVLEVVATSARSVIETTGVVQAEEEVTIIPEVSGRVVAVSDALQPGGRIDRGDVLLRIDARNYRLALQQEEARVETASLELETERGRGAVAEREWQLLGGGRPSTDAPLALRRPHLQAAESSVASARSGVELARLNLQRTVIRAPWNALVIEESVAVGQVVGQSSQLARLVGADRFRVRVTVPVERLTEISIPNAAGGEGAAATVVHDLGEGREVRRPGRVSRLEGQLDTETRMARLLITVEDPLDEPDGEVPLLPGTFVTVELEGQQAEGVVELPRATLHDGHAVWVVNDDDRLERHEVTVGWGSESSVFVTAGLGHRARVVTSPLSSPIEGARARVVTNAATPRQP